MISAITSRRTQATAIATTVTAIAATRIQMIQDFSNLRIDAGRAGITTDKVTGGNLLFEVVV